MAQVLEQHCNQTNQKFINEEDLNQFNKLSQEIDLDFKATQTKAL